MNLKFRLLILLLFFVNICFSQDWITTNISDFTSVKFPSESQLTEANGETVFFAQDEYAYYIASVRKISNYQSTNISKENIQNLYEGFAKGTIEAAGGTITSKKEIEIQNRPALELEYIADSNPNLPSKRFKRIIYINQSLISIDFWLIKTEDKIADERKAKFFNSIEFTSSNLGNSLESKNESNKNETDSLVKTSFFIGQIIFFLFLVGIIIGIVFLIIYLAKRKKRNSFKKQNIIETPSGVVCKNCETETNYTSKYCRRCGYELEK